VSALKVPKHQQPETDAEYGETPTSPADKAHGWQYGDLKAHGAGSPARRLQSHLAERLHRAEGLPIQGALATLAVLCLSLSLAGLYLITIA
jgi:hypothetical protein